MQTRTPTQVASHAQKYFIRQQNTQKRKRRASLFDIQQGPGDGTTTFVAQQMSGGSQNGGSDATIATTTTKVKGSNNGTSSSLTKMLKNNGKGLSNDKLNSREEESMRTLADMVLTHDARQQKNNTKQQRQDQNEQQKQQQQQHQQFLREQKEYANGHPIAGQFYGAQSPPQTIPMTGSYYYNPMFAMHSFDASARRPADRNVHVSTLGSFSTTHHERLDGTDAAQFGCVSTTAANGDSVSVSCWHPSFYVDCAIQHVVIGPKSSHDGYSEAEFTIRGNPIYGGDQGTE